MDVNEFLRLFAAHGALLILVVMFLEHLNMPGFPAGIILPAIGVLVRQSELSLFSAIWTSILGSILGSLLLYAICYRGGAPLLDKITKKSPKLVELVAKSREMIKYKQYLGIMLIRLVPMVRTISSIPAGFLKVPLGKFTVYSTVGICGWNITLILFGYFTAGILW